MLLIREKSKKERDRDTQSDIARRNRKSGKKLCETLFQSELTNWAA
jgi:hypothetical protein